MSDNLIIRHGTGSPPDNYSDLKNDNELACSVLSERVESAIFSSAQAFLRSLSCDAVEHLKGVPAKEEAYAFLKEPFREFLEQWKRGLPFSKQEEEKITVLALELLVEAIFYNRMKQISEHRHSHPQFSEGDLYTIGCILPAIEYDYIKKQQAEEERLKRVKWEKAKSRNPSIDEDKEDDPDLAPAEKMRVLKNALWFRREFGYDPQKKEIVIFNPAALSMAKEFFKDNPHVPVSSLLTVLDRCAECFLKHGKIVTSDKRFYLKNGRIVAFLLKNLDKVLDQLKEKTGEDLRYLFEEEGS